MITISHWEFKPKGFPERLLDLFDEARRSGPMPPPKLLEAVTAISVNSAQAPSPVSHGKKREPNDLDMTCNIGECCSSIVITGDPLGSFWTCSIISSLVREELGESSDHHSMTDYTNQVKEITQLFIHQQSIGRRLAFVILVGHLCSDLTKEYNKIIEYLEKLMKFSVSFHSPCIHNSLTRP